MLHLENIKQQDTDYTSHCFAATKFAHTYHAQAHIFQGLSNTLFSYKKANTSATNLKNTRSSIYFQCSVAFPAKLLVFW